MGVMGRRDGMLDYVSDRISGKTILIEPIVEGGLDRWVKQQSPATAAWISANGFKGKPGQHLLIPDAAGGIGAVALGVAHGRDIWSYGGLPLGLPEGAYRLPDSMAAENATAAALGWALGGYVFDRYKKRARQPARLAMPKTADKDSVRREANAIFLVRDLVNTPAEDMGPAELAAAAREVARAGGARFSTIVGEDLLQKNYPCIHAVGRASSRAPRLIDLRWGSRGPKVTLVGKGVCFDSGGLDIKGANWMLMMKKDMGGAAHVLALSQMIMAAGLDLRLRLLIPAVENSISANAYRPMDIIRSRKGLTVEIGNTDAEGRVILCDALTEADGEKPDLLVDMATLTGSARVALGPDLPVLYANDDAVAESALRHGKAVDDALWRLPLHKPYRRMIDSKIADINNSGDSPFAGSITAALFLADFVDPATHWMHFDIMAWNPNARPGRPEGGEAQAIRGLFSLIAERAGRPRGKKPRG
jgi:leucyl aminopeptidase